MWKASVTIVLVLVSVDKARCERDYCKVCNCDVCDCKLCRNETHGSCDHHPLTEPACTSGTIEWGVFCDKMKSEIVRVHNVLRNVIATGKESRGVTGKQPQASNMKKLVWDDELAIMAQRWVNQCIILKMHDPCRKVDRFSTGQNMGAIATKPIHLANKRPNWERIIRMWYNEVSRFNNSITNSYRNVKGTLTEHFTQFAWANTAYVGCGFLGRVHGKSYIRQYVCNYGPAGNVYKGKMYKHGKPASNCPRGYHPDTDPEFPGLCAPDK